MTSMDAAAGGAAASVRGRRSSAFAGRLAEDTPTLRDPLEERLARLADLLIARGTLDRVTLERARRVAGDSGHRLDAVLIQLGLITESALAAAVAELLSLPIVGPARYPATALLAPRLAPRFLRSVGALPLDVGEGCVALAVRDPLDDYAARAVAAATGLRVSPEIALPIELEAAFARLYPEADQTATTETGGEALEEDTERLRDLASEAPVIRLVNQIVFRAVETQASDIHIEPFADRLRIRYRYDGALAEAESQPARLARAVTSRVKIMARLDIAERRLPQDGRIKLAVRGQDVDFRVSTVPSLHGETVVLRILDRSAVAFDYARLGLAAPLVQRFEGCLARPNGIVLVTGPTGSGKTTTLYTGLLGLNAVARKIVTIEDPIEFQLDGINQIQVKPSIGLSFAALLRSILRQDPDVIMVGEIRDLETAQIAVQAALTGHLVLSTVHTNSAAATVTRLRDMGLEDYLLTAVLRGVLAQRLVRRLCEACRSEAPAAEETLRRFGIEGRHRLYHAAGCPACRGTGFRGRLAVAEFFAPDAEIERLILKGGGEAEIEQAAVEHGMRPLLRAGLDAALAGLTTVEEVVRAIKAEA